jgi:hypothetical protein
MPHPSRTLRRVGVEVSAQRDERNPFFSSHFSCTVITDSQSELCENSQECSIENCARLQRRFPALFDNLARLCGDGPLARPSVAASTVKGKTSTEIPSKAKDFSAKSLLINYPPSKSFRSNYLRNFPANPMIPIERKKGGEGGTQKALKRIFTQS